MMEGAVAAERRGLGRRLVCATRWWKPDHGGRVSDAPTNLRNA